jgi:small-conductance mechanosensitive channel
MKTPLLTSLLSDLSEDLQNTNILWQVGVVFLCFALASITSSVLKRSFSTVESRAKIISLGIGNFSRVLWPTLALIYILAGKAILENWQHTNLLKLLFPIIGSFALMRFGFYVVRNIFVRDGRIGSFLALVEKVFATLVWLGVILHFTGLWQELFSVLGETVISVGRSKISLLAILQALVAAIFTLILAMWMSAALEARLMKLPSLHSSLKVVLSRLGRTVLILIAILIALSIFGIDLTVLSVFGGALGVGLGFGLQKITSSYVSGFIILFDRSMSIGDMISVDKFSGIITQINTRYTVVRALDGVEAVIPNEMLVSNPVQNYSLSDRSVLLTTDVAVAYKTDLESLLPLLSDAVASINRVSKKEIPSVYLTKFGADGLELRIGFWINDPENGRLGVLSEVNRAIWRTLKAQGIEVPFPQRVVTMTHAGDEVTDPQLKKA